jgi:hypothetical protein
VTYEVTTDPVSSPSGCWMNEDGTSVPAGVCTDLNFKAFTSGSAGGPRGNPRRLCGCPLLSCLFTTYFVNKMFLSHQSLGISCRTVHLFCFVLLNIISRLCLAVLSFYYRFLF